MYSFCLMEITLYLDTHPFCKDGLAFYKKYRDLMNSAIEMYTEKYGPLSPHNVPADSHWTWAEGPWPWEMEA